MFLLPVHFLDEKSRAGGVKILKWKLWLLKINTFQTEWWRCLWLHWQAFGRPKHLVRINVPVMDNVGHTTCVNATGIGRVPIVLWVSFVHPRLPFFFLVLFLLCLIPSYINSPFLPLCFRNLPIWKISRGHSQGRSRRIPFGGRLQWRRFDWLFCLSLRDNRGIPFDGRFCR